MGPQNDFRHKTLDLFYLFFCTPDTTTTYFSIASTLCALVLFGRSVIVRVLCPSSDSVSLIPSWDGIEVGGWWLRLQEVLLLLWSLDVVMS